MSWQEGDLGRSEQGQPCQLGLPARSHAENVEATYLLAHSRISPGWKKDSKTLWATHQLTCLNFKHAKAPLHFKSQTVVIFASNFLGNT